MERQYDLVIIGSGPAGLSAAVYGMRAGLKLLVVEKNPMSGGQVLNTYEVDNYLGMPGFNGFDMGMKFREHADKLGTPFVEAEVTGIADGEIKTVCTTGGELRAVARSSPPGVKTGFIYPSAGPGTSAARTEVRGVGQK